MDAGATWVAPGHTAVRDLARRLDCEFVPQFHEGKGVMSFGGKRRVEAPPRWRPTADETSGTMNGAILSGQRAATEVAARLNTNG